MNAFEFEVTIKAMSKQEAERKIKALCGLSDQFTTQQVEQIAQLVKNNPAGVKQSLQMLGIF